MDNATIHRLNAINREFYRVTADEFDQTRGQAWLGWDPLLPHLKTPLSVLDVGCGNGRFGLFLIEHFAPKDLYYHGIDNNLALLEHARAALKGLPNVNLEERDIIENPPDSGFYDLVVLFGVIHHIPGAAQRQTFMRSLAQHVKPSGIFAFACWRFYEYERFRQRIVPWPADIQVEANDFLLDWRRGEVALRYCHYVDDTEHAALIAATGITEIQSYRADGSDGAANRYSLLRG